MAWLNNGFTYNIDNLSPVVQCWYVWQLKQSLYCQINRYSTVPHPYLICMIFIQQIWCFCSLVLLVYNSTFDLIDMFAD